MIGGARIGVLGGTLDPIHLGHLDTAAAARTALALERILIIPSHVPPHRTPPLASAYHRFAMAALAVNGIGWLSVSDEELCAPGPSFTADTLSRLHAGGLTPAQIFFITGADAFAEIATWRRYPEVLDLAQFVVVSRPGFPATALPERLPALAARMTPPLATSRPLAFARASLVAKQLRTSSLLRSKRTSSSTGCMRRARGTAPPEARRIICMAKTEKRRSTKTGTRRLPGDVAKAVSAALDKKAGDVVVLDLRNTPAFTDFFVLCSGQTQRQVKAIADAVEETLRAARVRPAHVEGYDRAEWVLMDFFTFIVHVFTPQTREFYSLERLWGDAERIEVSDEAGPALSKP